MSNTNAINEASSAASHARKAESYAKTDFERELARAMKYLAAAVEAIGREQD
jgi:hypothetical protein